MKEVTEHKEGHQQSWFNGCRCTVQTVHLPNIMTQQEHVTLTNHNITRHLEFDLCETRVLAQPEMASLGKEVMVHKIKGLDAWVHLVPDVLVGGHLMGFSTKCVQYQVTRFQCWHEQIHPLLLCCDRFETTCNTPSKGVWIMKRVPWNRHSIPSLGKCKRGS